MCNHNTFIVLSFDPFKGYQINIFSSGVIIMCEDNGVLTTLLKVLVENRQDLSFLGTRKKGLEASNR